MKIESKKVIDFTPIALKITLESEDDVRLFKIFCGCNATVADALRDDGQISASERDIVHKMLGNIYRELHKG